MMGPLNQGPALRQVGAWVLVGVLGCVGAVSRAQAGATAIDPVCPSNIQNFYECQQYLEPAQLIKTRFVHRKAHALRIRLDNGKSLVLRDSPLDEDGGRDVAYSLSAVFDGTPYLLVTLSLWEGSVRWLINQKVGSKTVLDGAVLLSPEKHHFAVWSNSAYDGVRLQLWKLTPKPRLELSIELGNKIPTDVHWAGEGRLCYRLEPVDGMVGSVTEQCLRPDSRRPERPRGLSLR